MTLEALKGETIMSALAAAGILATGSRRDGLSRGPFCGMGVCQECLVTVDGRQGQRACMTPVDKGMRVLSQGYAAVPRASSCKKDNVPPPVMSSPALLIVGGGPAGLSAAKAAALCGIDVALVDERATLGGQFFKQLSKAHRFTGRTSMDAQHRAGSELIDEVERLGVRIWRNAVVWGAFGATEIAAMIEGRQHLFAPSRIILATGAYERGVPIPGWTLPGFITTGAAQTLMRTYRVTPGRQVLIAGNGPLNFQVAADLVAAGVKVAALVETARAPGLANGADFVRALVASPGLIGQGMSYLRQLRRAGVPIRYGSAIVSACGNASVSEASVAMIDWRGQAIAGTSERFEADAICVGYGFLASNELARALGCEHFYRTSDASLVAKTDADGLSTASGIYLVGDGASIGGADAAQAQGFIAGCAAARSLGRTIPSGVERALSGARHALSRHRAFQAALWRIFSAPLLSTNLASEETVICRCESVSLGSVRQALSEGCATIGSIKRRTRLGMGRCQGRYCVSLAVAELEGQGRAIDESLLLAPRAPGKPVTVGELAAKPTA